MKRQLTWFIGVFGPLCFFACGDDAGSNTETPFDPITYETLFASDEFTSADTCGGCHTEIYDQWQGSMHQNALEDPFYRAMHAQASEETNGAIDAFCTVCHTPIGTFSGEVPPLEGDQISDISRNGVQCDFCHNVEGTTGTGNAGFLFGPSNTKKGPFDDAVSPFHETQYSELHTRAEFCGMCHDVRHPINGTPLESTYTEWKNGPYAEDGIQCQDCHMTPGPQVTKPNPGKAAIGGPEREHIWTHHFGGGNATSVVDDEHRALAEERLQAAATVTVDAPAATPGASYEVGVDVENSGAGHYLPTGLTDVRQVWLEVLVADATGNALYRSGELDETGNIAPDVEVFHTVFGDVNGEETHKPWEAVEIISDNRIGPKESVHRTFAVDLPDDVALPLDVTVTLHYRSAPQWLVDELMGEDALVMPVIDMAVVEVVSGTTGNK